MVTKLWIKILKYKHFSLRKSCVIALTPQLNSTEAHTHISRIARQMPHFSILTLKLKLRFFYLHYCVNTVILNV
jgi:hypothetical protein